MRIILLAAAIAAGLLTHAQNLVQRLQHDTMPNLVPNPGFEEVKKVQCGWTQQARKFNDDVMIGWNSPTETTPDHFTMKADPKCWSHPGRRTNGKASPHAGDAMAGIKVWGKGNTPTYWHEYLQVQLPVPLEAGVRYIAEVRAMRANFSGEASNNIGIVVTDLPVRSTDNLPLYITPVVNEEQVIDKKGWHKVQGVFEARGTERYVLIGNFYGDEATLHIQQQDGERGAYYFIDDVNIRVAPAGTALTAAPKASVPPPPKKRVEDHASTKAVDLYQVEPEVDKRIRLDNIGFEFGKATLTPESSAELEKLAHLMIDYPRMRIEIEGHTDDVGSDAFNLTLSNDRAKAVVDHLAERKVEAGRMSWKGYGETRPMVPNKDDAARGLNRRVEFRVVER